MSELISAKGLKPRDIACIAIAIAVIALTALLPETEGLTYEGRMVLGILGAGIILWITESIPLPATALFIMTMMPLTGVCTYGDAFSNAIGSTVFFLMGTFAFTVAWGCHHHPHAHLRWSAEVVGHQHEKDAAGPYVRHRICVVFHVRRGCLRRFRQRWQAFA